MPNHPIEHLRNVALVGHNGAGKTSLAEALLFKTGATRRLGSVNEQTSHLDFTEEEKEKGCSFEAAVCYASHGGVHINIVDTPGLPAFAGQAIPALAAADTAVCVVAAKDGIQVNTRKMMERAESYGLARMIVINKIDSENVNIQELYQRIVESFGTACVCVNLPADRGTRIVDCWRNATGSTDFSDPDSMHEKLLEAIVGVDDQLMERYLAGELKEGDVAAAASRSVAAGVLIPVAFTNSLKDVGISELLDAFCTFSPSPAQAKPRAARTGTDLRTLAPKPEAPFMGIVFKIMNDPKSNIKYSAIRCLTGSLKSDTSIHTTRDAKAVKAGHLHALQGAEHSEVDSCGPGGIVGVAKLDLRVGDTILGSGAEGAVIVPETPVPMYSKAISPKARADGDKISIALAKYTDEDPCFRADRELSTGELTIRGMDELHVRTMVQRMERHFKLQVEMRDPRIPYRETISKTVRDVEYTHKKQTGGAGQFARVVITLEPNQRSAGYEFVDDIFGGAIDHQFRPSVDKGIRAQLTEGILAGFPVVDVKVRLTDGKTHPVDSKDIAFQIAGRGAFKEAFLKAHPILLEPIVNMEVTVPAENVGDIQGDLASRRGRPLGQDMLPGGLSTIKAQVPLSELSNYSSTLSSITGGQGTYSMELSHYDTVPGNVQQQVIEKARKQKEAAAVG